jgi:hypothetical protein
VTPGCEWVIDGEGTATEKVDGTCCMVREGRLYKRHERKPNKRKEYRMRDTHCWPRGPKGWEPAQDTPDPAAGKWPGWVPVGNGPEDRWFREGFEFTKPCADGTYELIGAKVQGNPYGIDGHELEEHGTQELSATGPVTFTGVKAFLAFWTPIEGIVWHHPDGRMAKIKRRDFGLPWPV